MFKKILIANRSEIAVRVINACKVLGIGSVAVYSEADLNAKHRHVADEAVFLGPPPPNESYLDIEKIIAAAKETGAEAIHPGYGFLAENHLLPKRCKEEGIVFIGPSPESMLLMGNKVESRIKMTEAGVPLVPGMTSSATDPAVFREAADKAGYPVMIKAAAGGGGKGMRIVHDASQLGDALEAAQREAKNAFGDDTVYLEKYIANPRHVEFQVLADSHGHTIHLFERECSIQRRHQKIIEETPSVALDDELRARMGADAVKVAEAANYVGAGTVEFLLGQDKSYYFLEMNTRIQVEHPITEMVTGVDLVVEQIRVAAGQPLSIRQDQLSQRGHAIECRLYAEDGDNNFLPSTGTLLHYSEPSGPGIRVDSGVWKGMTITIDYDPIMAKLIVHAPDRETGIVKMIDALNNYKFLGVKTSKKFMIDVMLHPEFAAGRTYTNFIETHMMDRDDGTAQYRDLAAAIASIASLEIAPATGGNGGGPQAAPTPWQTIGNWQIGDSIDVNP
ncbi:acetyl-CoA carboxylase biotin carboxylase subunit [candidate division GN15 bacterium]|nr:acetyl-CoA carboxylase biotin carboxylase subunit [candidate division GN15 bacterium]